MMILYARDLDGTGSMHVCAENDPGAIAFVAIDDEEREALKDAMLSLQLSAEQEDIDADNEVRSGEPSAADGMRKVAERYRKHIAALSRLASKRGGYEQLQQTQQAMHRAGARSSGAESENSGARA